MIPYIESHTFTLVGVTFQTWGVFVAAGFALATLLAWKRAKRQGLDPKPVLDVAFWIFIGAFIGARLFHVMFYDPAYYLMNPWDAIDPREPGFSMFGGFLGAAVAFFPYMKKHGLNTIAYADAIIWGIPWGCGVGRVGCFLIHDHPGTLTDFILGVKYADGSVRHDLGLYLSLIGFATGGVFLWLNRKERQPGFWFAVYLTIEGLVRFSLDFLRVADVTYFGLTPTQYLAIPMAIGGMWWISKTKKTNTA